MALTVTPSSKSLTFPEFSGTDVFGAPFNSNSVSWSTGPVWIMFICNHCPYVQAIEDRLISTANKAIQLGVTVLAICSNDPTLVPEDGPEQLAARSLLKGYPFKYIADPHQKIAKLFQAVCTPDFFIFNQAKSLSYRGRLDDNWKNPQLVTKTELMDALLEIKNGRKPLTEIPSMGCSLKMRLS